MAGKKEDLGERRHHRIGLKTSALVFLQPNGTGMGCSVLDISEGGVRLRVGALAVPKIFILELAPQIRRLCHIVWRQNDVLGAAFISPQQAREMAGGQNAIGTDVD